LIPTTEKTGGEEPKTPGLTRNYENLQYLSGLGNQHTTEQLPEAIPKTQNSPQKCNYGLYAEQVSGT